MFFLSAKWHLSAYRKNPLLWLILYCNNFWISLLRCPLYFVARNRGVPIFGITLAAFVVLHIYVVWSRYFVHFPEASVTPDCNAKRACHLKSGEFDLSYAWRSLICHMRNEVCGRCALKSACTRFLRIKCDTDRVHFFFFFKYIRT